MLVRGRRGGMLNLDTALGDLGRIAIGCFHELLDPDRGEATDAGRARGQLVVLALPAGGRSDGRGTYYTDTVVRGPAREPTGCQKGLEVDF